jgi:YggT family protein
MDFLPSLIQGVIALVIIDAVLSWFVRSPRDFPRSVTSTLTDPLYQPFRALLPPERTGGIDVSPMLLIFALQLLAGALGAP